MQKLSAAWWLSALLAACNATPRSPASDASLPCESPDQAGCAQCCVEQPGPTEEDRACFVRSAAGDDYAERAAYRNQGACPDTCRPCAACTRDRNQSYRRLLAKGCDCWDPYVRDLALGLDPCYGDGCACTCSLLAELSECGPPV